jgi:type I restriction enzyme S subunit
MGEWKEYKLGDLGTVVTGKTPSSYYPEEFGNDVPFVTPSDYGNYRRWAASAERGLSKKGIEKLQGKVLPEKSLLVTCIGSDMGKVVMNKIPVVTNQQINSIITKKLVDPNFLYYKLLDIYDVLRMYGQSGTAVPILNKGDFEGIEIEIPTDSNEQTSIASILSSLDDKIDLLHRQNKTLEALAETLFRQWFVEEAEEGWESGKLGDVLSVKGGTTPSTSNPEFWNGDINWTAPRDLSNHTSIFLTRTERRITKKGLKQIGSGLLPVGTVLLSSRAPIGYLAITEIPVAINQGYIAIVCDKVLSNYFIYLWVKHNLEMIINAANGSVFLEISKSTFKELDFQLPPQNKLGVFDEQIKPIFDKIKSNVYQIRALTQLRDTLLPKLMSGEVRLAADK